MAEFASGELVMRYTTGLLPLHLFYIAKSF
jgi:hypothetical protein